MTSWSNSVEDPEKHFLGNLLDDDNSFSAPQPSSRVFGESVTSGIPTASVINGVGPISSSQNGPSPFWPEPPPPYTPAQSPGLFSWTFRNTPSGVHNYDSISPPISGEETSDWEFFSNTSFNPNRTVQQKTSGTTEIHHHQHTHQHTHVLQVINKHTYSESPPPSFTSTPLQQFASVAKKATKVEKGPEVLRPQHLPPHSAPVVNKMPFSYRDVAARKETHSSGHSPTNQNRQATMSHDGETKMTKSNEAVSTDGDANNLSSKESKLKTESEFQKISRKKGSKEKRAMSDSAAPQPAKEIVAIPPVVDVPTRYQVLENLSSPKIVKTESVESDDVVFTDRAEKVESQDTSPPRQKRLVDAKKKVPSQPPKKRSSRKKNDAESWITNFIMTYLVILVDVVQDACKWLMTLIVDVCSKMTDITVFGFFSVWDAFYECLRRLAVTFLSSIISTVITMRYTSLRQWFSPPPPDPKWGLDENMALPTNAEEALERLLRIRRVDAYAVLGLRADCSDYDIEKHRCRLLDLFDSDKTSLEGLDEAEAVVRCAAELIGTPEARIVYKLNNLGTFPLNGDLSDKWEILRTKIEEARHTMQCDCGKRHGRIPTNISSTEARYCKRCDMKHAARTNDLWVETRLCGLAWVYFTCSEGIVYDITEWATCEANYLKHMRPNAHSVQYRLVSPGTPFDRSQPSCMHDIVEDAWGTRSSAQVSFRPLEPREEDRSRRAANRRQKRR